MGHIEPVRDQLMSLSIWVVTKPWFRTPSILMKIAPSAGRRGAPRTSFPVQGALHPLVDETDDEDGEEHHHGGETEEPDRVEGNRPREKEGDLEVEQDEQDRDQVVPDVELHAGVFEGFEAALVGGEFLGIGAVGAEDPADQQRADAHTDSHEDEQQYRQVVLEVHVCPRSVESPCPATSCKEPAGATGLATPCGWF